MNYFIILSRIPRALETKMPEKTEYNNNLAFNGITWLSMALQVYKK